MGGVQIPQRRGTLWGRVSNILGQSTRPFFAEPPDTTDSTQQGCHAAAMRAVAIITVAACDYRCYCDYSGRELEKLGVRVIDYIGLIRRWSCCHESNKLVTLLLLLLLTATDER